MAGNWDKEQWPELDEFRAACLASNYPEMERIAAKAYDWYPNENPENLAMRELASIYQAQWYALSDDLEALQHVIEAYPWTINKPWTRQGWLPITQAASTHGSQAMIEYLIEQGADPTLSVGSPDDRATVVEMARLGKNPKLSGWLNEVIRCRT